MPKIHNLAEKCRTKMVFPSSNLEACKCEESNLPPWTGEMHGLSQALLSRSPKMRLFWWTVMAICICCGTTTTTMVIVEYLNGPTATSTTIRLVNSLELPSITICPKVPDALNDIGLLADIKHAIPGLSNDECLDLVRFWIGGYGLENMDLLPTFNRSYLKKLNQYFHTWSSGYSTDDFFDTTQDKYGYNCNDLFYSCELGGVVYDCCNDLFVKKLIMRRGICYTTRAGVNQSESDDMGRLVLSLKALPSITTTRSNYIQDQIIVYVTDNHEKINDFPRFYLYPNEWNRMRFTARFLELLEQAGVCTDSIFGKDSECIIRRWLKTNIVDPYNCTLSYLNITGISISNPCDPFVLASNYYSAIQLVWSSSSTRETCTPGCKRWEYQITMQQSKTLHSFEGYLFNLEVSFNDLQYEHVKEVYTISIPGLISQIGGQFGFFLGLSIITFLQMILYGIHYTVKTFYNKTHRYLKSISENRSGIGTIHPRNSFAVSAIQSKMFAEQNNASGYCTPRRQSIIQLNSRLINEDDLIPAITKKCKPSVTDEEHDEANKTVSNDDSAEKMSICSIDAANLSYIPNFASDIRFGARTDENSGQETCKKCNLVKRQYFNKNLFKGDVSFAYRKRWIGNSNAISRTVSDHMLISRVVEDFQQPNFSATTSATYPRAHLVQNE